jgi:AraC-like DNA-binding protein
MLRGTVEELATAPVGRYVAGVSFAHFCASHRLWGVILWGQPTIDDARELGRSLVLELAPPAQPHVSIIDGTRLAGTDPLAFRAADAYLRHHAAKLAAYVERVALVRPAGLEGAVMAGAFDVVARPYPVEVFADAGAACAWLGMAGQQGIIDRIHAEVTGTPHDVGRLRAVLEAKLDGITIERAARTLGISERSLQRKLADAGTTFKAELAGARVRVAQRLLRETDTPLTEIAFEVGSPSLQSFSALFRRHAGETPSTYRARWRPR